MEIKSNYSLQILLNVDNRMGIIILQLTIQHLNQCVPFLFNKNRLIIYYKMKVLVCCFFLIFFLFLQVEARSSIACLQYLHSLQNLYNKNQTQYYIALAPYALLSGKILDDMGLPNSCLKNPNNNYWTVQMDVTQTISEKEYDLDTYYGLCFTNQCDAATLNQSGAFLLNSLLKNSTFQINSLNFVDVDMEAHTSVGSVLVCVLISLFIVARMISSLIKWGRLCVTDSEEQAIQIQLEESNEEKQAGRMPEAHGSFVSRLSLSKAFGWLLQKEQSRKIVSFSLFKIFSIPFLAFGYLFYLSNYGAYNYFSFNQEIYGTYYARIAVFAYYLPDIFFFISGYLLSRKLIQLDEVSQNKQMSILKAVGVKLVKLYPLYLAVIFIYWFVTPSLHAGPLWSTYIDQVNQCYSTWWRSFLLIDNWFSDGCFSFAWYVQVEIQFTIVIAVIFFIYAKKRLTANILLALFTITSFVLLFALSGSLPSSIETAISDDAQLYFQSFYSHLFFYLFGVVLAFALQKQSVKAFLTEYFINNVPVYTSAIVIAFSMVVLIVSLPGVWTRALQLQLAFCRVGILISFIIFFMTGMVNQESSSTYIHKISNLSYSIILFVGLIANCGFWGLETFGYVDAINLASNTVTTILLSVAVGGFVGVVFDFVPFTIKSD